MTRIVRAIPLRVAALCAAAVVTAAPASDPMKLLTATGVVDPGERARVESGGVAFVVLPVRGRDLAVFGVTRTVAGDARLVAWTRVLDRRLDHDRYTLAIGRFSDRPQLSDVGALALEDEDLNDLRKCRPGDCGVKLSAAEMQEIRAAAAAAGDAWKPATQLAFRRVVVARARDYLDRGLAGSAPYADRKSPISPGAEFEDIAARVGFDGLYGFRVLTYLQAYPAGNGTAVESFLYWSKESLGAGKPIVSITHVAIFRELSGATTGTVIAARQVFATHYLTGSLSLTTITGGLDGAPAYLVYLRRVRTDAFEGLFGMFVRHVVEGRIRAEAPAVLDALRRKLEADDPPDAAVTG